MKDKVNAITVLNHRDGEIECFICTFCDNGKLVTRFPEMSGKGSLLNHFFTYTGKNVEFCWAKI